MRRHRRDLEILSEMNLTNLLDTAFILLIAFMLVAPMLKHGIDLDLPVVSQQALQSESNTVVIAIAKRPLEELTEPIYIEDKRVDLDELEGIIRDKMRKFPDFDVAIEADKTVTYETFAKVLGLLKNLGIDNIGLVTEPEELE